MDSGKEQQKIQELKNLKTQLRWWKSGLFVAGVFVVVVSVSTINNAFRGLVEQGPTQDKYIKTMSASLKEEIVPLVEDMAKQTISEVQPQINKSIDKANKRLPELAQASLAELDKLEESLPKRGEAVLKKSFGEMLVKKESELQAMFPEATPEQIDRLLVNLAESSGDQAQDAAYSLFGKHYESLQTIHVNLEAIANAERASLVGVDPNWEMGLLVVDLFREELQSSRPDGANGGMMASATDTISAAKSVVTAKAPQESSSNGKTEKAGKNTKPGNPVSTAKEMPAGVTNSETRQKSLKEKAAVKPVSKKKSNSSKKTSKTKSNSKQKASKPKVEQAAKNPSAKEILGLDR